MRVVGSSWSSLVLFFVATLTIIQSYFFLSPVAEQYGLVLPRANGNVVLSSDRTTLPSSQATTTIGLFYPFIIRDSRRLTDARVDGNFHIFDYVDIRTAKTADSDKHQLFLDAHILPEAVVPCQQYSVACYRLKILQVFRYVLDHNLASQYFFFIEADNELCVAMNVIEHIALQQRRYFIGTGVGFSGWIMRRDFMETFVQIYSEHRHAETGPDIVGAQQILIPNQQWSVTRQYLVSHSLQPPMGGDALTVKFDQTLEKHLPRCLEPQRSNWPTIMEEDPLDQTQNNNETLDTDIHGWDYFNYRKCPDAEIYPCDIVLKEYRK